MDNGLACSSNDSSFMDDGKKDDDDDDKDKSKKKNRCVMCRKKVGLTGKKFNKTHFTLKQFYKYCYKV